MTLNEDEYTEIIEKLLSKHFGVDLTNLNVGNRIFEALLTRIPPHEFVNHLAERQGLQRIDQWRGYSLVAGNTACAIMEIKQ